MSAYVPVALRRQVVERFAGCCAYCRAAEALVQSFSGTNANLKEDDVRERVSVSDAERDFAKLVNRIHTEGISVELEREDEVVARLTPAGPRSPLKIRDLNAFLLGLPRLDDDVEAFREDLRDIRRQFPAEANPWEPCQRMG